MSAQKWMWRFFSQNTMSIETEETKVDFSTAANGEKTCSVNGLMLHSAYNPSREAERFSKTVSCEFIPKFILVTGACLSYCANFLRKTYPSAIICAVQYSKVFSSQDNLWDKVFYLDVKNQISLSDEIFNFMGDEGTISCFFVSWHPSEKVFQSLHDQTWKEIKNAVLKSRNVLATRSFFARRWAKNAIRFCLFAKKTAYLQKGNCPVVICASGPSLKGMMETLKEHRKKYFLLAVSSALLPLTENSIIPDLVISTDGGYWAKKHLIPLLKKHKIPLALPPEASCYAKTFSEVPVIPLSYGDGISEELIHASGYEATRAVRNGTVSGTAAMLAQTISSGKIFYCGLDLSSNKGFTHTQPNELENTDSFFDSRIATQETRLTPRTFPSVQLDIYRSWFSTADFNGNLYRLSNHYSFKNHLGKIPDVDSEYFIKEISSDNDLLFPQIFSKENNFATEERRKKISMTIMKNVSNPEWIKNAVPADAIVYERSVGTPNEERYKTIVEKGMMEFSNLLFKTAGA